MAPVGRARVLARAVSFTLGILYLFPFLTKMHKHVLFLSLGGTLQRRKKET